MVVLPMPIVLACVAAIYGLVPSLAVTNKEELYLTMAGIANVMPELKHLKHTLYIVKEETVNEPNAGELILSSD